MGDPTGARRPVMGVAETVRIVGIVLEVPALEGADFLDELALVRVLVVPTEVVGAAEPASRSRLTFMRYWTSAVAVRMQAL